MAWSAPGKVEGDVVFCNRGSESDFENLRKMGVDVNVRFQSNFTGLHLAMPLF